MAELLDGSKYLNGIQLIGDEAGHKVANYEIVSEHVAKRLAETSGNGVILELCCGIGATTFVLARHFQKIIAVDINTARIALAQQNMQNLGVTNVEFFAGDIFAPELKELLEGVELNAVYTDVEWTTTGTYGQNHAAGIEDTNPPTDKVFSYCREHFSTNICMRLPKTISQSELRELGNCEIEGVYRDDSLRFLNVYFGSLVVKPESRFDYQLD